MKTIIAISRKCGVLAIYAIGLAILCLQFRTIFG